MSGSPPVEALISVGIGMAITIACDYSDYGYVQPCGED